MDTNVTENKIWGILKPIFKVYIDDIFATTPKMVSTHNIFNLNKYIDFIGSALQLRERERGWGGGGGL